MGSRFYKKKYLPPDIRNWNSTLNWAKEGGLKEKKASQLQLDTWFNGEVLSRAETVMGAWSLSRRINKLGIQQVIFTSREPYLKAYTNDWMAYWGPWMDEVIIRKDPHEDRDEFKVKSILEIIEKEDLGSNELIHIEDNRIQAQMVVEQTGVRVFYIPYLDDAGSLNHLDNVFEVPRVNGWPNLWPIYKEIIKRG